VAEDEQPARRRSRQVRRCNVTITELDTPPLRFVAGVDAVAAVEQRSDDLLAQIDDYRALPSCSRTTAAQTDQRAERLVA